MLIVNCRSFKVWNLCCEIIYNRMDHPPFPFRLPWSPCVCTCCADRQTGGVLPVSSMCHRGHHHSCPDGEVAHVYSGSQRDKRWQPSGQLHNRLACIPVRQCGRELTLSVHPVTVRETCLGSRALGLRVWRHLCSYKPSLLFLHLNIVVEKKTSHSTQKIQHLFSDGKRLTFLFRISTLCCQPPSLRCRSFDFTLNRWFIFLHPTVRPSLVTWWW